MSTDASQPTRKTVAIIGAGISGIIQGAEIHRKGVLSNPEQELVIFEKAAGFGGVWFANTYPGAACDIVSHIYSISWFPKYNWSRRYAGQEEIREYYSQVAHHHNLEKSTLFQHTVLALHWDDTALHWAITVRNDTAGTTHHYTATTIISATGQLNRPKRPAIPGAALFPGPQFHTAEWNHAVDLARKRVAVIGTGPSAAQVIPAIAGTVKELHVFQRSPVHILPRGDYVFSGVIKTLFTWFPLLQWLHHLWLYVEQELGPYRSVHLNTAENRGAAERARLHMQRQIPPERMELRRKFTPEYPYGCKRPLFSDSYYPTFLRDNVHLHTTPPAEITKGSIITAEGSVAVDVIIWATGFETQDLMGHIEVRGHQGVLLKEKWGDEATAYLGTSTSGFPNLFWVYGPATGLLWGSLTFMFETQAAWNVMMLRKILAEERAGRRVAFAVRRERENGYNLRVQRKIAELAYGGTGCESFYKNSRGVVTTNFPWRLVVYWWWLRSVDWRDYERWEVKV